MAMRVPRVGRLGARCRPPSGGCIRRPRGTFTSIPLREVGADLKDNGRSEPPRLCLFSDAHESSLLREVERGDDYSSQHREAEEP